MNYIDLINRFWEKDLEFNFSDKEITLYFYLLRVSNSISWKNPFGLSNTMTIAKFNWGKTSFDTAKNNLKKAGLIDFEAGNGRGNVYRYFICEKDNEKGTLKDTLSMTLSDTLSNTFSDTLSDQKPETSININKTEIKRKSKKRTFSPPAQHDVIEYLMTEKKISDYDAPYFAQRFVDFYSSKDWMVGKNKMTNWKSALTRSLDWEDRRKRYGKQQRENIDAGKQDLLNRIEQEAASTGTLPGF